MNFEMQILVQFITLSNLFFKNTTLSEKELYIGSSLNMDQGDIRWGKNAFHTQSEGEEKYIVCGSLV